MKRILFLLLTSTALLSHSGVLASEEPASEDYEFTLSPIDETSESHTFEKKFYPIGQMLVNKKTQEGLTLVCRKFDDQGKCSRFQFALHPVAGELSSYQWASPVFQISNQFSKLSFEEQQAKLRKWIRKKISAPRMTGAQRGIIGFMTFWSSLLVVAFSQTGKVVHADSIDWIGAMVWGGMFTIGVAGTERLDLISPFFTRSSGALIGIKTEEAGAMSENYLIKQTPIRNRVFQRIRERVAAHSTYHESKWVARATLTQE